MKNLSKRFYSKRVRNLPHSSTHTVSITNSHRHTRSSLSNTSLSITHLSFSCLGLHFKTKNTQQMIVVRCLTMLHLKLIPTPCKHDSNSQWGLQKDQAIPMYMCSAVCECVYIYVSYPRPLWLQISFVNCHFVVIFFLYKCNFHFPLNEKF
jgi:hypothetical protein